jgi:putative sigma-54 modulation protein
MAFQGFSVDVTIHGRNVEVADAVRAAVEEKLTRLARHLDGMERAEVRFSEERNPRISEKEVCEVTMYGHGHIVRAKAAAGETMAAVDRVVEKLEHRVDRLKGRLVNRSRSRRTGSVDSGERNHTRSDDDSHAEEDQPRIVKTKQFSIKPMTPEEASLQMDLLGHDFFFFTNADTDLAAVVYRRKDGNIGLIDAT